MKQGISEWSPQGGPNEVWTPPANEGDVPKWVQKIRLQPEVTSSYIQMVKLNPLKDYVVSDEEDELYWVTNEEEISVSVNKCLAYEIKKPLVSSLTKALVQLSNRKFVAGTMVRVVTTGWTYSYYEVMAKRMGLGRFEYGVLPREGEEGMILGCEKHCTTNIDIYAVLIGDREVLFSEGGLEAIHNV
jgi:hypothetical protein